MDYSNLGNLQWSSLLEFIKTVLAYWNAVVTLFSYKCGLLFLPASP